MREGKGGKSRETGENREREEGNSKGRREEAKDLPISIYNSELNFPVCQNQRPNNKPITFPRASDSMYPQRGVSIMLFEKAL